MSVMPENLPVWVNEDRCKACDMCVRVCPSGVLAMKLDPESVLGAMVSVEYADSCIGCGDCELSCPDFAIFVADRKEFKFAKATSESKERQAQILANNCYSLKP